MFVVTIGFAYGQRSLITVQTDHTTYEDGNTIVISGQVTAVVPGTPVTIQIFREGNLIDIAQITVAQDGTFTDTIIAQGPLWKKSGEYTLKASYLEGVAAETVFNYTAGSQIEEKTETYEVNAGSSGTFDVEYRIKGGAVKKMVIDQTIFGMVISIESKEDGNITLKIPRAFLDAKKQDGKDETFIILIDGTESPHQESNTSPDYRTISINFQQGDSNIEIIGTFVIPEFGHISLAIFTASLAPIVLLLRKQGKI